MVDTGCPGRGHRDVHSCTVTTDELGSSVSMCDGSQGRIRTETWLAFGCVWGSQVGGIGGWEWGGCLDGI